MFGLDDDDDDNDDDGNYIEGGYHVHAPPQQFFLNARFSTKIGT